MDAVDRRCTYLLPIRRTRVDRREMAAFAEYFVLLRGGGCDVIVVDGSPPAVFSAHRCAWERLVRHEKVDPQYRYLNGKVNGVHTGVGLSRHEKIILADDDIRYTRQDIALMCELLDRHELVKPQNYLSPLPWWARLESARMLINRGALRGGDYPGTCGLRRAAMLRVGHYDGNVLFDNEEIVRHFIVQGAKVCHATAFFILKQPSSASKWLEQRPRQAYEDFVMRAKTLAFAAMLPLAAVAGLVGGGIALFSYLAAVSIAAMALALRGRREGAARFFPATLVLYAPLWVLERAISVYWAFYWRVVHGGYPFGDRLLSKGTGDAWVAGGRLRDLTIDGDARS